MTIICVRDGVMAVDSAVSSNSSRVGTARKWCAVPDSLGGGYAAASGSLAPATEARRLLVAGEALDPLKGSGEEFSVLHLRADGRVREFDNGFWIEFDAPFYVLGSGSQVARGALAAGASAERAAEIACDLCDGCGGPVTVLRLEDAA